MVKHRCLTVHSMVCSPSSNCVEHAMGDTEVCDTYRVQMQRYDVYPNMWVSSCS